MLHSVSVRDYMSASLVTFTEDMDVLQAIHLLLRNGVTGAPVVDSLGSVIGYLSEKDCLRVALDASYHEEWGGRVGDFMTPKAVTVDAGDSVLQVARIFYDTAIKTLPVMQDNRLVGKITRSDVLRAFEAIR